MITPEPPEEDQSPIIRKLVRGIQGFESLIILALIFMMMLVVALSAVELGVILWKELAAPPMFLLDLQELLEVLGYFMMVLIGLELLETIKNYLTQHALHIEVVLLVAMIAVARKVIILNMKDTSAESMIGIAVLLFSLSGSYYLIKRGMEPPRDSRS